jgi:hypothetical protein
MDLREERELAFQRLLRICQSGLVSITDFRCATPGLFCQFTSYLSERKLRTARSFSVSCNVIVYAGTIL